MKLSVGDASVQIVTMPGHTAGTLSFLFEVKDNGKPLRIAYVGGTAIPFDGNAALLRRLYRVVEKMAKAAADFGATALLSNHTEFDNALLQGPHRRRPEARRSEPVRRRQGRRRPVLHGRRRMRRPPPSCARRPASPRTPNPQSLRATCNSKARERASYLSAAGFFGAGGIKSATSS